VIDATITRHEGTFYLFFKDERFGHKHGGEFRFIKVATAPVLDGPYTVATEAVTPSITEGRRCSGQAASTGRGCCCATIAWTTATARSLRGPAALAACR
jgi:hypothetical protein